MWQFFTRLNLVLDDVHKFKKKNLFFISQNRFFFRFFFTIALVSSWTLWSNALNPIQIGSLSKIPLMGFVSCCPLVLYIFSRWNLEDWCTVSYELFNICDFWRNFSMCKYYLFLALISLYCNVFSLVFKMVMWIWNT